MFCLFERIFFLGLFNHRNIDIIHMKLFYAQQPFSQFQITLHRLLMFFYGANQISINTDWNISAIQCCFQRRTVFAFFCKKSCLTHICIKNGRNRICKPFVAAIQVCKRFFSDLSVFIFQIMYIAFLRQRLLISIFIFYRLKGNICIIKHTVNIRRGTAKFTYPCQKFFFLFTETVLFCSQDFFQKSSIFRERLIRQILR